MWRYISAVVSIFLQGCVFPDPPVWMPERLANRWGKVNMMAVRSLSNKFSVEDVKSFITESSLDVFKSFYTYSPEEPWHYYEILDNHYQLQRLVDMMKTYTSIDPICTKLMDDFWIRRPCWYFPTRDEVTTVRKCVVDFLHQVSLEEEWTDIGYDVASAALQIGEVVFSPRVELVMRTPESQAMSFEGAGERLESYIKKPELIALVQEAMAHPSFESGRKSKTMAKGLAWIKNAMRSEVPSDSDLLHANDFLDHVGNEHASLTAWWEIFFCGRSTHERLEGMKRMILVKPDVVADGVAAHDRRLTNYQRGDFHAWNTWRLNTGFLISSVWKASDTAGRKSFQECVLYDEFSLLYRIDDTALMSLFVLFDVDRYRRMYFQGCFLTRILDGRLTIPRNEDFAKLVALILHLIKVSNDTLADVAWMQVYGRPFFG